MKLSEIRSFLRVLRDLTREDVSVLVENCFRKQGVRISMSYLPRLWKAARQEILELRERIRVLEEQNRILRVGLTHISLHELTSDGDRLIATKALKAAEEVE